MRASTYINRSFDGLIFKLLNAHRTGVCAGPGQLAVTAALYLPTPSGATLASKDASAHSASTSPDVASKWVEAYADFEIEGQIRI